jgi:hypothetical protein
MSKRENGWADGPGWSSVAQQAGVRLEEDSLGRRSRLEHGRPEQGRLQQGRLERCGVR